MQTIHHTRRAFIKNTALAGMAAVTAPHGVTAHRSSKEPFCFLFQGDSITDGNRGRNNDPNHIMGHGFAFSIASRLGARFPEKELHFFNRGISGNTITDLTARWQQDTLDIKPDVLSVLIGINDVEQALKQRDAAATKKYETGYRNLLTQTKAELPGCLLVLCEPFIAPAGRVKENWKDWQLEVQQKQKVVQRLAKEYDAVFVPLQSVFDAAARRARADYWVWDGIHPTVAGHELIAQQWLKQVGNKLKFVKEAL